MPAFISVGDLARRPALAALDADTARELSIADMCRPHAVRAVERIAELMERAGSDQVQLGAARELLDRTYGKPMQAVAGKFDGKLTISWMLPGDNAKLIEHE